MTEKTLTLADGQQITMRKPSEDEVLRYLDKVADLQQGLRPSADACDDGDHELEACVTAPPRAELEALMEDFPLLNRPMHEVFMELAGNDMPLRRADELIPAGYKAPGRRLVGFVFNGTPRPKPEPLPAKDPSEADEAYQTRLAAEETVHAQAVATWEASEQDKLIVLQKLSRFEMKALEFDANQQKRLSPKPSALAKIVRQHVITLKDRTGHADTIREHFAAAPLLLPTLGQHLYNAASARLQVDLGKP